jgi:hypothetical protein
MVADLISRAALPNADLADVTTGERVGPVTPGDVLREAFMIPLGLSARALAARWAVDTVARRKGKTAGGPRYPRVRAGDFSIATGRLRWQPSFRPAENK